MRITTGYVAAVAACLALSACGQKQPSGQVVATVKGKEITATDLKNEMGGFNTPDPKIRKAAEQQALNAIISRKVLAQAAEKAGITKTPGFAQQLDRMKETLTVQSWEAQIAKGIPTPSREEATRFVAEHPEMYGARKLLEVDQVRFPRPTDAATIRDLAPLKSLEDVAAYLKSHNIAFRTAQDEIDPLNVDPRLIEQLSKLPPGEVFIVPAGNALIANHIRETRDAPVTAEDAIRHATQFLKAQHTREALQRQFEGVLAAAKKDVKYAKAYEPPPPPKASAAPAAAPAAQTK